MVRCYVCGQSYESKSPHLLVDPEDAICEDCKKLSCMYCDAECDLSLIEIKAQYPHARKIIWFCSASCRDLYDIERRKDL